ncbi:MAG: ROK family protein [Burkholderiales bacterium]|nr:ROK family protein [Burkholderiales bacterium]
MTRTTARSSMPVRAAGTARPARVPGTGTGTGVRRPGPVDQVRVLHRMRALLALRDDGPMPRVALGRVAGHSGTTVSKVVAELLAMGLLREDGAVNVRAAGALGRPQTPLQLVPEAACVLAMAIEPVRLRAALFGLDLRRFADMPARTEVCAVSQLPPAAALRALVELARKVLREAAAHGRAVQAVAVVLPGITDTAMRVGLRVAPLEWRGVDVAATVERALRLPVLVHNNTRAMALAEFRHRRLGADDPLLFVQAHYGLGAALVNSAEPDPYGHYGVAELGHIPLGEDGFHRPAARGVPLVQVTNAAYLCRILGLPEDTADPVAQLERRRAQGEGRAAQLWAQTVRNLGTGLATAVNLLNPHHIVLGGIYTQASDEFLAGLQGEISARAAEKLAHALLLERSVLGADAALEGAALVGFDRVLRQLPGERVAWRAVA